MRKTNLIKDKGDTQSRYRLLNEHSTRLESIASNCSSITELFCKQTTELRNRLRDLSETLLFKDPVGYGRISIEIDWIRNYHDFMHCYKKFKKKVTQEEIVLLNTHFVMGIGNYDNLLRKICIEFKLDLSDTLPELKINRDDEQLINAKENELDCLKLYLHRIFLCIGDLFRYLDDLGLTSNHIMAVKWYTIAITYNPSMGMPYNQLGTLSGTRNYGLDSAFYYMRCLLTEKPFDGAESNLSRLFSVNQSLLNSLKDQNASESYFIVKQCICRFLLVTGKLWKISTSNDVSLDIQLCFESLKAALELQPKLSTSTKPTYLDTSMIYKMGLSILMLIGKHENLNGLKSNEMFHSSVAFGLNFLYLLLDSFIKNIKEKIEKVNELSLSKEEQTVKGIENNHLIDNKLLNNINKMSKENTPELSPRRTLSRLRRRKAAIKYDDIDTNFLDFDDDDSELSELEETALSTIDVLEISSDISDSGSVCDENDVNNHFNSSDEDDSQISVKNDSNISMDIDFDGILEYIYNDTCLPLIKIFCDWLRGNKPLLTFTVKSFPNLFDNMANLLNLLIEIEKKSLNNKSLQEYKYIDMNWIQKFPLTVDCILKGFPLLEAFQLKSIDFNIKRKLNQDEMSFICIESILSFGHYIVNNIEKGTLKYDINSNKFMINEYKNGYSNGVSINIQNGVSLSPINNDYNDSSYNYDENNVEKQKQMMRSMAHLWLKSEVNKLEKVTRGGKFSHTTTFLVIDSSAYIDHLNLVKDITFSRRFIVVVPKIVLSLLDQKKKTSGNCREAIRWLENEVQKGNRFVKFLKENEKLNLAPMKYPRRKEKDSFNFFVLLEYCHYLQTNNNCSQLSNNKNEIPLVTLLYSSNNNFPQNCDNMIKSLGLTMENIEMFASKWRKWIKTKT